MNTESSKWSWRKRVTITEAIQIDISKTGIYKRSRWLGKVYHHIWDDVWTHKLATSDFIDPPTGEELKKVLFGLNGAPSAPDPYQIIRW